MKISNEELTNLLHNGIVGVGVGVGVCVGVSVGV
jgi:hypothetical protein